jgi:hypothetical protein
MHESAGGSGADFPVVSTRTLTWTNTSVYKAVTITAGFNKLSGYSAGETPGATSALVAGSVASQTASLTKFTGTKSTRSVTGTATGSAAAAQSTGAAGGRTAMGMSVAGVLGVALPAFPYNYHLAWYVYTVSLAFEANPPPCLMH